MNWTSTLPAEMGFYWHLPADADEDDTPELWDVCVECVAGGERYARVPGEGELILIAEAGGWWHTEKVIPPPVDPSILDPES